ncbi:MAG: AraC family transcriptional regulator, partial [Syntrophomonadaceae bacterium]|nr:AraC family transcriptional regulator [Syntrophomonadaceae bacterium]
MERHNLQRGKSMAFCSRSFEQRQELFSVLELFPIPMEVFSADGISLFVNQAFVDFFRIQAEEIVGRLNILEDPYINHKLGLSAYLHRVFAGEILSLCDLKVPLEEINNRYHSAQIRPTENHMYQDIICLPLRSENDSVAYVVTVFMTKHIYQMRLDALKAKEYMDANWRDDFDLDLIAKIVGMSRHHLAHLFKKVMGMTPYSYYQ